MTEDLTRQYYSDNPTARWLALTSICLATFINSIQNSSILIAIPDIATDLRADAVLVSWIPTAFLLSSVILLLPAGRLADIHGRKRIYLIGIVVLALASALACLAPWIEWLLLARLLQGMGAAMTFATGLALVMSIFTSEHRGVALGLASGSLYIGLTCGPLIGGWLTEHYGWRSVFMFPVPLLAISFCLINVRVKGEWKGDEQIPVDWPGCLLFAVCSTLLFTGVSLLPDPTSFIMLLAGVILLTVFIYQQLYSPHPLIRFRAILNNHTFSHSLIASTCVYSSNFPLIFLFSLYLQFIKGLSPVEAGRIMILQALTMAIVAPIAGRLSDKYEPRIIATTGCLIMFTAFASLQGINADSPLSLIAFSLVTLGLGFGLFTTPNNNAALSSINRERLSIGSALINLSRVTGNMLGTAVVLVLVSIIIGNQQIEPSRYGALLQVIHWVLALSCTYTLVGSWFSFRRGNIKRNLGI